MEWEDRLSVAMKQEESGRSPLLFPTIGLFAGGIVGYFVGRSDEPDIMIPAYIYTVPVGAAAGLIVGIVVEEITSQVEAQS